MTHCGNTTNLLKKGMLVNTTFRALQAGPQGDYLKPNTGLMKDIIIVGAGGLGREVFYYASHCIEAGKDWRIKGFIDDNPSALDKFEYKYPPVIGNISDYRPQENDRFLMAVAACPVKKAIAESLKARGAVFEKLVHPTSLCSPSAKIGEGIVVGPFSSISTDTTVGDFVTLNPHCVIGHDAVLGDYCTFSSFCEATGGVKIGEGVFFASQSTTVPKSKIGDWARVGINSFVIGKVKPGVTVLGNPAAPIFTNKE